MGGEVCANSQPGSWQDAISVAKGLLPAPPPPPHIPGGIPCRGGKTAAAGSSTCSSFIIFIIVPLAPGWLTLRPAKEGLFTRRAVSLYAIE